MFAYCRNNPVCRKDATGTEEVCATDFNENNNPLDDIGNPSGVGGGVKSGKLNFKSEADLNNHFEKHNPEFENKFKTPQEYVDAANDVIQNGEYVSNQNAYVKPYGANGSLYYSFVGLTHDHSFITTFHLKHVTRIRF